AGVGRATPAAVPARDRRPRASIARRVAIQRRPPSASETANFLPSAGAAAGDSTGTPGTKDRAAPGHAHDTPAASASRIAPPSRTRRDGGAVRNRSKARPERIASAKTLPTTNFSGFRSATGERNPSQPLGTRLGREAAASARRKNAIENRDPRVRARARLAPPITANDPQ